MNKIKNIIVVIALSASIALADDGHTGSGDRCTTCTPPPCTENCSGLAAQEPEVVTATGTEESNGETSLIESWTEMFFELIG